MKIIKETCVKCFEINFTQYRIDIQSRTDHTSKRDW